MADTHHHGGQDAGHGQADGHDHHADQWRKNIPADFDGRHADDWDGEIDAGIIYKSAVAVVVTVAVAFVFCWLLLGGLAKLAEKPVLSPLAEARERHLPPSPQLEASPTRLLTNLRGEVAGKTGEYGWADQSAGRVHIPVDKAIDLVLAGRKIDVERPAGQPVDVAAPVAAPAAAPVPATPPHGGGH
jgi:hypothetical protein